MTVKQNNFLDYAKKFDIEVLNIEDYINKDSIIKCRCMRCGFLFENTAEELLKNDAECLGCLKAESKNISDFTPFFIALDAASYVTGVSIFNAKGQLLSHRAIILNKRLDFLDRVHELRQEICALIKENDIKCIILEDIQYQQNPALFKKLAMLQGILRFTFTKELDIPVIMAMAEEWRSYNHIHGSKRDEQKKNAINKAKLIYDEDISEDESESIFLGKYGIYVYNNLNNVD